MCGHFGIYYKPAAKTRLDQKAIADGIYVTQLRGMHSLGLMFDYTKTHGKEEETFFSYEKALGIPSVVLPSRPAFAKAINDKTNQVLAFHCRAATRGAVNEDNSHPFRHKNITLMHNGTLRDDYSINNKYFDVDSKALTHFLGEGGTPAGLVQAVKGAYALVWMDSHRGTLNFLRNKERSFFIAENDSMIMWASEDSFLQFVAMRHNIKFNKIEALTPYQHVTVSIGNGQTTTEQLPEPPVPVFSGNPWGDYSDYYGLGNTAPRNRPALSVVSVTETKEKDKTVEVGSAAWFTQIMYGNNIKYATMHLGQVGRNPRIPSDKMCVRLGKEIIDDMLSEYDEVWAPTLIVGNSIVLGGSSYGRVLREIPDSDLIIVEGLFPVYNEKTEKRFPFVEVQINRTSYKIAKYNQLFYRGKIIAIDEDTGTITISGSHMPCFDFSINGQLLPQDAVDSSFNLDKDIVGNC